MTPLNTEEIKIKFPKSVEKLKKFCLKGFDGPGIPPNMKEQMDPNMLVDITIKMQRGMYEFFDENEVYVFIARDGDSFGYGIGQSKNGMLDNGFDERREAEKAAFTAAFEKLEKQLK